MALPDVVIPYNLEQDAPHLIESLLGDFPLLYSKIERTEEHFKTPEFRVSPLWFPTIWNLSLKLEAAIVGIPPQLQDQFHALQVKSKDGGLRFYMNRYTEEMRRLIEAASDTCERICERCGGPSIGIAPLDGHFRLRQRLCGVHLSEVQHEWAGYRAGREKNSDTSV